MMAQSHLLHRDLPTVTPEGSHCHSLETGLCCATALEMGWGPWGAGPGPGPFCPCEQTPGAPIASGSRHASQSAPKSGPLSPLSAGGAWASPACLCHGLFHPPGPPGLCLAVPFEGLHLCLVLPQDLGAGGTGLHPYQAHCWSFWQLYFAKSEPREGQVPCSAPLKRPAPPGCFPPLPGWFPCPQLSHTPWSSTQWSHAEL